jgi:D-3-phosphoglycerate dehydrogenase
MVSTGPPLVVMSERLGAIGDEERRIEAAGAILRSAPLWDLDDIVANASSATAIILGAVEPFDETALAALRECRVVVRRGVGVDNVDVAAATRLGIMVAIVPDASVEEVSDHALASLLALERRLLPLDRAVHAGAWSRDPSAIASTRTSVRRLADLTLGIIGLGRIGQAVARKARPLYAEMLATDPVVDVARATELGVRLMPIEELARRADHITLHAPLDSETRHLVDARFLSSLRPGAMLVNTSRGDLVDEPALMAAVDDGRLAGAVLDVTSHEPLDPDDPLLQLDGLLLTAHSAASSTASRAELARRAVDAVLAVLAGDRPAVLADPGVEPIRRGSAGSVTPGESPA